MSIIVLGGGLVGPVMAMYLAKAGHRVHVWEKRSDPRVTRLRAASSVNLTLCTRGFAALEPLGLDGVVRDRCAPAYGRLVHDTSGRVDYQPYGTSTQAVWSITREELHALLLEHAERAFGVSFTFDHECVGVDPAEPSVLLLDRRSGRTRQVRADVVCAADGVHSTVREQLRRLGIVRYTEEDLPLGYREITIPRSGRSAWLRAVDVLHLWPRHDYMLIAFPNRTGDFTGSLHLPFHGDVSWDTVREAEDLEQLFARAFPNAVPDAPELMRNFFERPPGRMTTVRCEPWHAEGKVVLLGDAAHAIYPVYGQGVNAGFEDCLILSEAFDASPGGWARAFRDYSETRRRDLDAMAELCVSHSVELRDLAVHPDFQRRKMLERRLHEIVPDVFVPMYSMIVFSRMPYAEAIRRAREQEAIVDRLLARPDIEALMARADSAALIRAALAPTTATVAHG